MQLKHLTVTLLVMAAPVFTGCDFLRTVAGRPTSAQIDAKADSIKAADERARIEKEAREKAAARTADSLAALEWINTPERLATPFSTVSRLFSQTPSARYACVIGSFGEEANAKALCARVEAAGYGAAMLRHRNGHVAVLAAPADDPVEFRNAAQRLASEAFFPAGAWILVKD